MDFGSIVGSDYLYHMSPRNRYYSQLRAVIGGVIMLCLRLIDTLTGRGVHLLFLTNITSKSVFLLLSLPNY